MKRPKSVHIVQAISHKEGELASLKSHLKNLFMSSQDSEMSNKQNNKTIECYNIGRSISHSPSLRSGSHYQNYFKGGRYLSALKKIKFSNLGVTSELKTINIKPFVLKNVYQLIESNFSISCKSCHLKKKNKAKIFKQRVKNF